MSKKKRKPYPATHSVISLHRSYFNEIIKKGIDNADRMLLIDLALLSNNGIFEFNTKILAEQLDYKRPQSLTCRFKNLIAADLIAIIYDKSKNTSIIAINPAYCLVGQTAKSHYHQVIGWEEISKKQFDKNAKIDSVLTEYKEGKYMTIGQQLYQEQCDSNAELKRQLKHQTKLIEKVLDAISNMHDTPAISKAKNDLKKAVKYTDNVILLKR
jgi:hypothetical protein